MTPMGVCRHVLVVAPPQPLPIDRAPIGGDQEILIPPRVDSTPSPMPRSGAFSWQVEDRCNGSCQEPWWWLHKRVNLGQTRGIGGIDRRIFWMMGKTVGACVGGPSEQCGARRTGVARPRKAVRVSGGRQQAAPVGSAPLLHCQPACGRRGPTGTGPRARGRENCLHRTLVREDDCRLRTGHGPAVMGILRRAALNMVRTVQQNPGPDVSIGLLRNKIGRHPWILAAVLP